MEPTRQELTETVRQIIAKQIEICGSVDLGSYHFDRVPCSRRVIYSIAKSLMGEFNALYIPAQYSASGNRAFQRNHKRGHYSHPHLIRVSR